MTGSLEDPDNVGAIQNPYQLVREGVDPNPYVPHRRLRRRDSDSEEAPLDTTSSRRSRSRSPYLRGEDSDFDSEDDSPHL